MSRVCRRVVIAASLGAALALAGCVWPAGPEDVRRELARAAGVRLDREVGITVGPLGMAIARWAVRHAEDEGEEELTLAGVRRVEVGVYRVAGPCCGLDARERLSPPAGGAWSTIVRVHEPDEDVLVLGEEREGELRRLLVVIAEAEEWTLVRLSGRLDAVLDEAVALALDEADRPDLEPALAAEMGTAVHSRPLAAAGPGPAPAGP